MKSKVAVSLILLIIFLATPVNAGKIVVNHDEWTLSNSGYSQSPDADTFALNLASYFTGGSTGNFLVYSNNFGLTGSSLQTTMTGAGHTWTVNSGITFDQPTLSGFDAVFIGGNAADNTVLTNYVNSGGNVYLMGGTGAGGAAAEAARWNTFLNNFGLEYGSTYNGISGNLAISSSHPLFSGVSTLYHNNGNSISDLLPGDPRNQILISLNDNGLYAIFDDNAGSRSNPIPVPGAFVLAGLGSLLVGYTRRRRGL